MQLREVFTDGYKMTAEQRRAEIRQSFWDDPPSGEEDVLFRFVTKNKKGQEGCYAVMRYERLEIPSLMEEYKQVFLATDSHEITHA